MTSASCIYADYSSSSCHTMILTTLFIVVRSIQTLPELQYTALLHTVFRFKYCQRHTGSFTSCVMGHITL